MKKERAAGGLPVELDVGDAALPVDEGVGVHAKALHVAVVERDAEVVQQKGELLRKVSRLISFILSLLLCLLFRILLSADCWKCTLSAYKGTFRGA